MTRLRIPLVACWVALSLACAGIARSPQTNPTAAEALTVDPGFRVDRLDNGLTYFIRANSKPENRAAVWLAVNAGAVQEDDDQRGLAHFVEHMAFNGTKNFAKHEIIDYMESIGMRFGPDVNAYTTFDETVYMLEIPTDDGAIVDSALRILRDWAGAVLFEDDEIDKERGVVLEEWRLGRGADMRMLDEQLPVLFKDSRYAVRLPIGKKEIIENAPYDALRRFYRDWYRPDLMAVIAVGDFDAADIEQKVETLFSDLGNPAKERPREIYPVPDHAETLTAVATDPEATSTTVGVYYKLAKRPDETVQDYRRVVAESLYHSMINQRLDELRQKADPPFVFAFSTSGAFVRSKDVYFQAARAREGETERGLEALLTEVERVERYGFTAGELERAKKELQRGYEQAYRERDKRESQSFAGEVLRHFLGGEPMPGIERELEMVEEFLPGIGVDELNALARQWITRENRVILLSAPEKEGVAVPGEPQLLAVFERVAEQPLEPYVDDTLDRPLLAQKPEPGRVVEQHEVEEIGVTEWRLANGVLVALKPTDFKNDQVLLGGMSPGGTSLVDDALYESADNATSLMAAGGLGEFDRIQLEKALAGKVAGARVSIGELEESVRASASPQDLETMFQLLYLDFTAPRIDEDAVAAWFETTRSFLENRVSRPETVFNDRMTEVLTQGHPRRKPPTVEMLDEIDVQQAYEVYRERFADAGDFRFVIVGNFDTETIRPLVETYLGGLPATGRAETWRDVGARTPPDVVEFEVRKGLEPKSRVSLWFTGDAEWSREEEHTLASLASALRVRLRETLREDMGGTYGVSVSGGVARRPNERYRFGVSFGCAPENVAELTAAVFAQIERIKSEGVDDALLGKVRESQKRKRETDLEENRFWVSELLDFYRYDEDPRLVLDFDRLVDGLTSDALRDAARKYLRTDRYVLGRLVPETTGSGE